MTAPTSPGNSGVPVFDDKGNLVAIVTSVIDKQNDPNAENINFAARADALLEECGWMFFGDQDVSEEKQKAHRDSHQARDRWRIP